MGFLPPECCFQVRETPPPTEKLLRRFGPKPLRRARETQDPYRPTRPVLALWGRLENGGPTTAATHRQLVCPTLVDLMLTHTGP